MSHDLAKIHKFQLCLHKLCKLVLKRNQIDYFCIHERWKTSVVNTKTLPGADCGSDHELLVMSMRVKIKKTKAAKHPIRYDMYYDARSRTI